VSAKKAKINVLKGFNNYIFSIYRHKYRHKINAAKFQAQKTGVNRL